jgi:hypothetical protein
MAAVMPALQDAPTFDGMTVEDEVDLYVGVAPDLGTGVVSGCLVTQDTGSDMKVAISSGVVKILGNYYLYAGTGGTPLTVTAAGAGDRRDTIILRLSGGSVTATVIAGTIPTGLTGAWTRNTPITTCLAPMKGPMNWSTSTSSTSVNYTTDVVLSECYVAFNTTALTGTTTTIVTPTSGNLVDKTNPPSPAGGFSSVTKTGAYTANSGEVVQANNAAGGIAGGTPITVSNAAGALTYVIKTDSSTNAVVVAPSAGTINGASTFSITGQWQSYAFQGDGSNVRVLTGYSPATDITLDQLGAAAAPVSMGGFNFTNLLQAITAGQAATVGQTAGGAMPFVVTGCVWTAIASSLGAQLTAGTVMINGILLTVAAVGVTTTFNGTNGTALSALGTLPVASVANVPTSGTGTIVSSGGTGTVTWTGVSGSTLTGCTYSRTGTDTVASGAAVVLGQKFTANDDTYHDLQDNGDGTAKSSFSSVANNAQSPALASSGNALNTIRLAIMTVGASSIAGVNQGIASPPTNGASLATTTVAAGSNGQSITGLTSNQLSVAANSLAPAGLATVDTTIGTGGNFGALISYTGGGGTTTLTGVTVLVGSGNVATGGAVAQVTLNTVSDGLGNIIFPTTPRPGLIGYRVLGSAQTTTGTNAVPMPTLTCQFVVPPGPTRRVKCWAHISYIDTSNATAGTSVTAEVVLNGTPVGVSVYKKIAAVAGDGQPMHPEGVASLAPGTYVATVEVQQSAAGTLTIGSAYVNCLMGVELV